MTIDEIRKSSKRVSSEQVRYLEILFNDCQFTKEQRNAFLSAELTTKYAYKIKIEYLDELTMQEASDIINILKEFKEVKKLKRGQ